MAFEGLQSLAYYRVTGDVDTVYTDETGLSYESLSEFLRLLHTCRVQLARGTSLLERLKKQVYKFCRNRNQRQDCVLGTEDLGTQTLKLYGYTCRRVCSFRSWEFLRHYSTVQYCTVVECPHPPGARSLMFFSPIFFLHTPSRMVIVLLFPCCSGVPVPCTSQLCIIEMAECKLSNDFSSLDYSFCQL